MNHLQAVITEIENVDNLNIVHFDFSGMALKMMSLGLSHEVKVGGNVLLGINPSHIALAKDFVGQVSCSNRIHATIISVHNGELLSSIHLKVGDEHTFESIITLSSSKEMLLEAGDSVQVLIQASQLAILEIL